MTWLDTCGLTFHNLVREALTNPYQEQDPDPSNVVLAKIVVHDLVTICVLAAIAGAVLGVGSLVGGIICGVGMFLIHPVTQNSFKCDPWGFDANPLIKIGPYNLFYSLSLKGRCSIISYGK